MLFRMLSHSYSTETIAQSNRTAILEQKLPFSDVEMDDVTELPAATLNTTIV